MTPWHRNEYILKGLFWGLWVFFALQVPANSADAWKDISWVLGWTCTGLVVGLIIGTVKLASRGVKPWDNWKAFPLLVVLESPLFIYAGIMLGLTVGVVSGREFAQPWAVPIAQAFGLTWEDIKHVDPVARWLLHCIVGGVLLGVGMYRMRQMEDQPTRFWVGLGVAAAMVYLASNYLFDIKVPDPDDPAKKVSYFASADAKFNLGLYILLGLPFFYLLTFSSEAEESEVEVMTFCAALGIALHLMNFGSKLGDVAPFLIPLALYFVYAIYILAGLRVFKHVLRGFSYLSVGQLALAIGFFRRARELNPASELANEGMLRLHNSLTLSKLGNDPTLLESLDFGLCLDRAAALLMLPPTPQARDEAEQFLALVEKQKPVYSARVDYLRTVSFIHAKQYEPAANTLSRILDPETPDYHAGLRKQVYFDALYLALDGPKPLTDRLGWAEMNKLGRRIEAIAAVERKLAADPSHERAKEYRTMLYSQLTEREFVSAAANDQPKDFNYEYVEQLGQQLVDDNDPDRRERGEGYLRIAVRGLPDRGPGIYKKLADVSEKLGAHQTMRGYTERIRDIGARRPAQSREGPARHLPQSSSSGSRRWSSPRATSSKPRPMRPMRRATPPGASRRTLRRSRITKPRSGTCAKYLDGGGGAPLEASRKIAELYGKMRDALNAVLNTEAALAYNSSDPDLLRKRDSYYYSVTIERLTEA